MSVRVLQPLHETYRRRRGYGTATAEYYKQIQIYECSTATRWSHTHMFACAWAEHRLLKKKKTNNQQLAKKKKVKKSLRHLPFACRHRPRYLWRLTRAWLRWSDEKRYFLEDMIVDNSQWQCKAHKQWSSATCGANFTSRRGTDEGAGGGTTNTREPRAPDRTIQYKPARAI